MSAPFSHSLRSLASDDGKTTIWRLLIGMLVLGAWLAWLCVGRVSVYSVTDAGRVEMDDVVYRVEVPVDGVVAATHLSLDRDVEAGDVLVELDTQVLDVELAEVQARLATASAQVAPLNMQIAAKEREIKAQRDIADARLAESQARYREAADVASLAESEAARSERLLDAGLSSEAALSKAKADKRSHRAAAEALQAVISRVSAETQAKESELEAERARLSRELELIKGARDAAVATIESIEKRIAQRRIRAPIAGRLGDVTALQVGSFLHQGDRVGVVVPDGGLKVVAEFHPAAVFGRIQAGQNARMRLDGFPWMQYGILSLCVANVASEIHDGRARVELRVAERAATSIPLQHGLPGTVEVEVERVSPLMLLLRTAGGVLRSGDEAPR